MDIKEYKEMLRKEVELYASQIAVEKHDIMKAYYMGMHAATQVHYDLLTLTLTYGDKND